jgi:1,4-alpha-glucan branching enzyme
MIEKKFTPKRTICKVTFRVPEEWAEREVAVVGDFNEWDTEANKLEQKNGSWETTLRLAAADGVPFPLPARRRALGKR